MKTPGKPLGRRVLIKPQEVKEVEKDGLIVPDKAINPSFLIGEVIGLDKEGNITSVKKGDIVAHKKYGMEVIPTDKGDLYLVEESSLIFVYE